jgi:UDP-3-O-[3-hydroxymyristoyl] glucosamine N-acyltransferase
MPDSRFFESSEPVDLGTLTRLSGATVQAVDSPTRLISRVGELLDADEACVTFLVGRRYIARACDTRAGACFVELANAGALPATCAALVAPSPLAAFAAAANRLHRPRRHDDASGPIHPTVNLEDGVVLAPNVVLGQDVSIGRGTYVSPGAVIGPGVCIGRDCFVGAQVTIGFSLIGDRVRIHAGAVIGEPGFGAAAGRDGLVDIPQLGRVIIQDGVTIGSGTCIDRGALGDTTVGENSKIDNLVQIGHNVVIGRNCVLAAHTGISGSVVIGDGCQLGGRAGVADHITIGVGARIAAAAGVMRSVPAGESWGGYPAKPVKRWLRETALLAQLVRRRNEGDDRDDQ